MLTIKGLVPRMFLYSWVVSLVRSSGSQRFLENSVEVIVHKRHRLNRSNESEPLTAPSKPGGGD